MEKATTMTWIKKIVVAGYFPAEYLLRLQDEFPDTTVVVCDGSHERIRAEIVDADIVCGRVTRDEFILARKLQYIHNNFVGVETMGFPELVQSPVIVTNGRGALSRPMAEHILAMALAQYRNLPAMLESQRRAQWELVTRDRFATLEGKTVGLLGVGSIGALAAKLFHGLDCYTIGYSFRGRPVDHVERIYTGGALPEFLAESDIVVNTLPLTPATRGLIGHNQFVQMKRTALFINVGRGATVDEPAMIAALREGLIAGAGLDVFIQEPLPADSPLWAMKNVLVCPHQSSDDPANTVRIYDLFLENLRRYREGEPLLNVVDKQNGY
jgi:phosphoglycerate dehydrogenase-like enzyme